MERITVFGPRGWLGSQCLKHFPGSVGADANIGTATEVHEALRTHRTTVAINAAGITGRPNIDWCQASSENMQRTMEANGIAPATLAQECVKQGVFLVHLSSASVFEATPPESGGLTEERIPVIPEDPERITWYAVTKRAGEVSLAASGALILRLHMPFSHRLHGRNLFTRMAGYPSVVDVANTITAVPDLLSAMERLIALRATGIVHVVNPEPVSGPRIMELYRGICDPGHHFTVRPLGPKSRPGVVLSTAKLQSLGITMRPTEEALVSSMRNYR